MPAAQQGKTVLVVEDSPASREVVMRILRRQGYAVEGAADAFEALLAIRRRQPDLVLLDIMMPGMDGITLLAMLHDEPATRELPVILLTALSDETRRERARELGAKEFLVKTRFSYDELLGQVEKHVRQ